MEGRDALFVLCLRHCKRMRIVFGKKSMKLWLKNGLTIDGIAVEPAAWSMWMELYSRRRKRIVNREENAIVRFLECHAAATKGKPRHV